MSQETKICLCLMQCMSSQASTVCTGYQSPGNSCTCARCLPGYKLFNGACALVGTSLSQRDIGAGREDGQASRQIEGVVQKLSFGGSHMCAGL